MQLGDARSGKLADNLVAFGRALRRAGVRTDSARMALAQQAALCVGLDQKQDLSAALEAVLISRSGKYGDDRGRDKTLERSAIPCDLPYQST